MKCPLINIAIICCHSVYIFVTSLYTSFFYDIIYWLIFFSQCINVRVVVVTVGSERKRWMWVAGQKVTPWARLIWEIRTGTDEGWSQASSLGDWEHSEAFGKGCVRLGVRQAEFGRQLAGCLLVHRGLYLQLRLGTQSLNGASHRIMITPEFELRSSLNLSSESRSLLWCHWWHT